MDATTSFSLGSFILQPRLSSTWFAPSIDLLIFTEILDGVNPKLIGVVSQLFHVLPQFLLRMPSVLSIQNHVLNYLDLF